MGTEEGQLLEWLTEVGGDNAGSEPGTWAAAHPWLYFWVSQETKMPPNERTWALVDLPGIEMTTWAGSRGQPRLETGAGRCHQLWQNQGTAGHRKRETRNVRPTRHGNVPCGPQALDGPAPACYLHQKKCVFFLLVVRHREAG